MDHAGNAVVTIDLGNGNSVTVNAFQGKVWVMNQARGASIGNELDEPKAMELAGAIISAVRRNRKGRS